MAIRMAINPTEIKLKQNKKLTMLHADKGVEQLELSYIPVGVQNSTATLGKNLALSYKGEHTLTI